MCTLKCEGDRRTPRDRGATISSALRVDDWRKSNTKTNRTRTSEELGSCPEGRRRMQRRASLWRNKCLIVFSTNVIEKEESEKRMGDTPAIGNVLSFALGLRKGGGVVSQKQNTRKSRPVKEVARQQQDEGYSQFHKNIFLRTIIAHKAQPVLPQIIIHRALHLDIEKVQVVHAWMARGAHVQSEEAMILPSVKLPNSIW